MSNYTYADVIIDPKDPRIELGAKYYCSAFPEPCIKAANEDIAAMELTAVWDGGATGPFQVGASFYYCLIRKKEDEERYEPYDFSDPEDREGLLGETVRNKSNDAYLQNAIITGFTVEMKSECEAEWRCWLNGQDSCTAQELYDAWEFSDGSPCCVEVTE